MHRKNRISEEQGLRKGLHELDLETKVILRSLRGGNVFSHVCLPVCLCMEDELSP